MNARELREERGSVCKQMTDLIEKGKEKWTPEDRQKFDTLDARSEELKKDIERVERAAALSAEFQPNPPRPTPTADPDPDKEAEKREKRYQEVWRKYMRTGLIANQYGDRGLTEAEKSVLAERRTTLSGTQTEGVGSNPGAYYGSSTGFFVPVGFVNKVEEAMKWYGGMLEAGTIFETANGQPLPFPTDNDTTISGELMPENTAVSTQGITWSQIIMNAWKFDTKLVPVSIELLQDSAFDLDSYLLNKFATRMGRCLNTYFTTGSGSGQPAGLLGSGVGASSSGQTVIGDDNATTPDPTQEVGYLDLINLIHSVDIAYRRNAKFMFHDVTLAFIKKLKDKYGRPLWVPGVAGGAPDTICGYPYIVNNDMSTVVQTSPISARKTVAFGALDKYMIRRVKDLSVLRLVERYAEFGVVGFLGFARYDGILLDAGTKPVKYLLNPAS